MSSCTLSANTVKSTNPSCVMPNAPTMNSGNRCTTSHMSVPSTVAPAMPYHSVLRTRSMSFAP